MFEKVVGGGSVGGVIGHEIVGIGRVTVELGKRVEDTVGRRIYYMKDGLRPIFGKVEAKQKWNEKKKVLDFMTEEIVDAAYGFVYLARAFLNHANKSL